MDQQMTFAEWASEGRAVIKGEKARFYRVNQDESQAIAVFELDQTTELDRPDTSDWRLITAEERKNKIARIPQPPKVIVDCFTTKNGERITTVWCGRNKQAIKALQKARYVFDMHSHRWRHNTKDPEQVIAGWEEYGYTVERGPGLIEAAA